MDIVKESIFPGIFFSPRLTRREKKIYYIGYYTGAVASAVLVSLMILVNKKP